MDETCTYTLMLGGLIFACAASLIVQICMNVKVSYMVPCAPFDLGHPCSGNTGNFGKTLFYGLEQ